MNLSEIVCRDLEARGLDVELCAKLGIVSHEMFGEHTCSIPFFERGEVVNHKLRTTAGEKKFTQDKDARKVFWNVDCVTDASLVEYPLIITEGEFDAIVAMQCGFQRVVSVPDGAPSKEIGPDNTGAKYSYVLDAEKILDPVREIILAVDGDAPGVRLLNDLAIRLGKVRCKWVRYPLCRTPELHRNKVAGDPLKDLNEVFIEYGENGVKQTIARAQWMHVDGIYRMDDLPPISEFEALPTNIPGLDPHLRLRLGDFTMVTGCPGSGKTTFVNELAHRMAERHAWPVAFASFEQNPRGDHLRALRTLCTGYRVKDSTAALIDAADDFIRTWYSFIVPGDDDEVTLDWTLDRAAATVIQFGAKLIVIDPWNELDHDRGPMMTETEYVGFAIRRIKRFAKKYQVHVILIAHPRGLRPVDGKIPVPTLYDINGSANFYNKADIGVIVHKISPADTLIRIAKSRYHDQLGIPGDVHLTFNKSNNRFGVLTETSHFEGDE